MSLPGNDFSLNPSFTYNSVDVPLTSDISQTNSYFHRFPSRPATFRPSVISRLRILILLISLAILEISSKASYLRLCIILSMFMSGMGNYNWKCCYNLLIIIKFNINNIRWGVLYIVISIMLVVAAMSYFDKTIIDYWRIPDGGDILNKLEKCLTF